MSTVWSQVLRVAARYADFVTRRASKRTSRVPVSAHDIARELRDRLPENTGRAKIQKLLYYCQGWHLAHYGEPLFAERIEAWRDGPVVAKLWADEQHDRVRPEPTEIEATHADIVDYVVGRYGGSTGAQLIDSTHSEAPWRTIAEADGGSPGMPSKPITHEAMRTFFAADEQYQAARVESRQVVVFGPVAASEQAQAQAEALVRQRSTRAV